MYYFMKTTCAMTGTKTTHILRHLPDGGVQSFPDVETNTGPERQAYLAWVAEGNTAEEWQPDSK